MDTDSVGCRGRRGVLRGLTLKLRCPSAVRVPSGARCCAACGLVYEAEATFDSFEMLPRKSVLATTQCF